ncbi:TonB-dependent siderophore receptor [Komagataeibacter europaeus]|uniref:TonB-dependent siderophore receptor n=1 Tax=Komagataeibacter europaeus TaxID=33995 RepID=UPI001FCA2D27|nr:TonB-dependent siderophore receptor [Komagataeibacter europaeus]
MLATTTALTSFVPTRARAETAQNQPKFSFSIPAGSLSSALVSFSAQSRIQVTSQAPTLAGHTTTGLHGQFTSSEALARLLQGSGLSYQTLGEQAFQIVPAPKAANITLGPVRVGGTLGKESATGPGVGYVAHYTEAGTKTDTPITEIPNSVYVVTKQEIIDRQSQNVLEALQYLPGVVDMKGTASNGSANGSLANGTGSIMMRGFASTQYVDGIMSQSSSAGETAFVERVETLMGPASVLYGQVGPGGLVATRLKQPTDTPIRNVTVGFGNWGRYEATFDVADKVTKSGNVKYRIAGIGVTQGTQQDYVNYKRVGVLPSLKWDIDDKTSVTVLGEYMYTPDAGLSGLYPSIGTLVPGKYGYIPRSRYLFDPGVNRNYTSEADFEYQFSHKFNKKWEFQQTFRYEDSTSHGSQLYLRQGLQADGETYPRAAWGTSAFQKTLGLDSRVIGHVDTGPVKQTLVAGVDFRRIHWIQDIAYDLDGIPSINIWNPVYYNVHPCYELSCPNTVSIQNTNETLFQKGVYFQDQIKFKNLSVLLGGRQDWFNDSGPFYTGDNQGGVITPVHFDSNTGEKASKFTWRAGFTYNFNFGLTPYFSYATSFIPQVGAFQYNGQPIKPLTGKQYEAGLKYLIPGIDVLLTAAAYHIKENHYEITDTENPGYESDAGTVTSKGVELSAHANITHDLHLTASYTFNDTRVTSSDTTVVLRSMSGANLGKVSEQGKYISGLPRNMANMFVDYTLPRNIFHGLGVNFGARYIGSSYADNANSYKVPDYILFDVGAHMDFGNVWSGLKGLQARLAMSNIANTRYVTGCGTSSYGGTCAYGQGRRVYGNLSYSW